MRTLFFSFSEEEILDVKVAERLCARGDWFDSVLISDTREVTPDDIVLVVGESVGATRSF